jgi:hypothetical protein
MDNLLEIPVEIRGHQSIQQNFLVLGIEHKDLQEKKERKIAQIDDAETRNL